MAIRCFGRMNSRFSWRCKRAEKKSVGLAMDQICHGIELHWGSSHSASTRRTAIFAFKPKPIYELAKISGIDVSNLNKIILFFEEVGAVKNQETQGRWTDTKNTDDRR